MLLPQVNSNAFHYIFNKILKLSHHELCQLIKLGLPICSNLLTGGVLIMAKSVLEAILKGTKFVSSLYSRLEHGVLTSYLNDPSRRRLGALAVPCYS